MQQAIQIKDQPKVDAHVQSEPVSAPGSSFVINLCSSTSPVALSPPDHAGLKRFTFFVSRRREEGRERFRLHMGYFETQEEAEKLLDIVREIYPGAWAGLAPGQRLRAAAAAAAVRSAVSAPIEPAASRPAAAVSAPAPSAATNPSAVATPAAAAASQPIQTTLMPPADVAAAEPIAAKPAPETPLEISLEVQPNDRAQPVPVSAPPAVKPDATQPAKAEAAAAAQSLSDVRAAIASLEDTSVRAPTLRAIPELKPAANIPVAQAAPVKAVPRPIEKPPHPVEELNDAAAMAVLENREHEADSAKGTGASAPATGSTPEKAVYAVQLMWSVQPIDMTQVPQLAIFSAYTLYGAEGNRDGRRWYGLRLGFFTDAVSAKQVAHYVRSEFSTVSVVPVTSRERERAKLASTRPVDTPVATPTATGARAATPGSTVQSTKFEFIEDKPIPSTSSAAPMGPQGPRTGRGAPGKRAKLRTPAQSAARATKPKKLTLEETLEILGAGELKVDDGRDALLNSDVAANAAASRPQPTKAKPSRLGRLFERLSERIGN